MGVWKAAGDTMRLAGRVVRKAGGPLHLVFFVTNRCDFECEHCFLIPMGELNNKSRELLSLAEIERVAASLPGLSALSLTGGEPFLRKDYVEIVKHFEQNTRLKTLSTITNGISTERILPAVEQVLADTGLSFFLSISVDGSEQTHNEIRRKENAFARTLDTIRELKQLRERFPQFSLGVNSTYVGKNYEDLLELYDVLEDVQPHYVTLNLLRGVDWQDRPEGLSMEHYRQLNARKHRLMQNGKVRRTLLQRLTRAKDAIMTEMLARTYDEERSLYPCYGGQLLGVLKDNGDVFPCEQLTQPMGNVRDFEGDFLQVWTSPAAKTERQFIVDRKCHCTYECAMSSNILFNPWFYPRLLREMMRSG